MAQMRAAHQALSASSFSDEISSPRESIARAVDDCDMFALSGDTPQSAFQDGLGAFWTTEAAVYFAFLEQFCPEVS